MTLHNFRLIKPDRKTQRVIAIFVAIFLIVFASRITRLNALNMEKDEIWSVWQTLGSPIETIQWTPYDWSPAYYLLVYGWRTLTGINPFTLRVMTALIMLLVDAVMYRVARKLFGIKAGLLAALSLSAFGYTLFLSTLLRAYLLNLLLWQIALWISLSHFDPKKAPVLRRGILLAVVLGAMFWVHTTAIFAIIALGLFTLILYGPRSSLLRWRLPTLLFGVIAAPEALNKIQIIGIKNDIVNKYMPYVPPLERILKLYQDFAGYQYVLWGALFLVASALILDRFRRDRKWKALLVWLLAPFVLLWVTAFIDAFNPRHLPWIMAGFALWISWGIAMLPRAAAVALGVVMSVAMFGSIPISDRYETIPRTPLVTSFNTLRASLRAGDVLLLDPKCEGCAVVDPEEWDYFVRAYFPAGVPIITSDLIKRAQGYRRIWYVSAPGMPDTTTVEALQQDRAQSISFGDPTLTFQLYELPPDLHGVTFENGIRFNGAEILNYGGTPNAGQRPVVVHEGETIRLRLFWSITKPVPLDYSVLTAQIDPKTGALLAQTDGPPVPLVGPKVTSQWQEGHYYVEERELKLSFPISTGEQPIYLSVYQWWDGVRIKAPETDANTLLLIGKVFVKSL